MRRSRVISEHNFGQVTRAATCASLSRQDVILATRAARASMDAGFERYAVVVDDPALKACSGQLEDVSLPDLKYLFGDIRAELQRRGEEA